MVGRAVALKRTVSYGEQRIITVALCAGPEVSGAHQPEEDAGEMSALPNPHTTTTKKGGVTRCQLGLRATVLIS